jgi:hypothetical protein
MKLKFVFFSSYKGVQCHMFHTLAGKVWNLYLAGYAEYVFLNVSSIMDVAATLDCYLSITGKLKLLTNRTAFYATVAVALLFECGMNWYFLVELKIFNRIIQRPVEPIEVVANTSTAFYNYTYYFLAFPAPVATSVSNYVAGAFASGTVRIIVFSAALLVLNSLLLNQLRLVRARKVILSGGEETEAVKNVRIAERKRAIMIAAFSLTSIALKMPMMVNYIHGKIESSHDWWFCFNYAAIHLETVVYAIPFLFYYFFNTHFKRIVNRNIALVLYPVAKVLNISTSADVEVEGTSMAVTTRTRQTRRAGQK